MGSQTSCFNPLRDCLLLKTNATCSQSAATSLRTRCRSLHIRVPKEAKQTVRKKSRFPGLNLPRTLRPTNYSKNSAINCLRNLQRRNRNSLCISPSNVYLTCPIVYWLHPKNLQPSVVRPNYRRRPLARQRTPSAEPWQPATATANADNIK